jgi:alanine-glyoxylate transaminase/serine-glyoxylate transaminase/serine-pyruvate transaminase
VDRWLEKERDVEVVTLVHCDTPSALYNPLRELDKVAADHGVLLTIDAVSSIGADEILFDQWGVGVLIGGPQKALNALPGLTILAVSKAALDRTREVGRETFYMNYSLWEEWLEKGYFPYTMPDVLIYALKEGLDKILEEGSPPSFKDIRQLGWPRGGRWRLLGSSPIRRPSSAPAPQSPPSKPPYRLPSLGDISGRSTECCWPAAGGLWRAR